MGARKEPFGGNDLINLMKQAAEFGIADSGQQIVAMFAELRQGVAAHVSPDVETLTGNAPRDFACFATDHARMFAPAAAAARR